MPITFTKQDAYKVLAANGITDVLLHFTPRNEWGELTPFRQWSASRGTGKNYKLLSRGRHLVEVIGEVIRDEKQKS